MIDNFHCSVKHNNNQNVFSIINDAVTYSYYQKSPAVLRPGLEMGSSKMINTWDMISVALSLGDTPNFLWPPLWEHMTRPGKHTQKPWRNSRFSMGESTISMVSLNGKLFVC